MSIREMFLPGLCWQEFYTTRPQHVNALNNAGFKMLRLFFNLRDLPYIKTPDQSYINHLFAIMRNGQAAWDSPNKTPEPMRAAFDFCKKYGWLPIVCMGTSEEDVAGNWIGRIPTQEQFSWLSIFAREFAIYLKCTMGFDRVDLEVYNEPSKLQGLGFGWDKYCLLAYDMATGWKTVAGYKVHIFADDTLRLDYLENILKNYSTCMKADYISTHIGVGSEDNEWERGLIQIINQKISKYPHLRQAVTELSFNGIFQSRMQQLVSNKVAMYGIICAIRNEKMGTATRIDDVWMYSDSGGFTCTAPDKAIMLTAFNKQYYVPYIKENTDMQLEKYYYRLKTNYTRDPKRAGVKFIQSILGLKTDGLWGVKTDAAVEAYQISKGLVPDKIVGPDTFKALIAEFPRLFDEMQYNIMGGIW